MQQLLHSLMVKTGSWSNSCSIRVLFSSNCNSHFVILKPPTFITHHVALETHRHEFLAFGTLVNILQAGQGDSGSGTKTPRSTRAPVTSSLSLSTGSKPAESPAGDSQLPSSDPQVQDNQTSQASGSQSRLVERSLQGVKVSACKAKAAASAAARRAVVASHPDLSYLMVVYMAYDVLYTGRTGSIIHLPLSVSDCDAKVVMV